MAFARFTLIVAFILIVDRIQAQEEAAKCRSVEAARSCGQCIKEGPECAWCTDPEFKGHMRCGPKNSFAEITCRPDHVFTPETRVTIPKQSNFPLGGTRPDGRTTVQMEPQQVLIKMKPGGTVELPIKYQHRDGKINDLFIQTSEFRTLGVDIEFSIECNGNRVQGRQCPNIRVGETYTFFAKVTLNECKAGGDIAVSVGISGYNTVSALYITPVCGCECEKLQNQEKQSPSCSSSGSLICGLCVCDPGRGGSKCECNLDAYNTIDADQLEQNCRQSPDKPTCSFAGKCECGECKCDKDYVTGKYCECDGVSCPVFEGKMCAAQGQCVCGKCDCEPGFSGQDCSCSDDTTRCLDGGLLCNSQGACECGKCLCNHGYSGPTCGTEMDAIRMDELDAEIEERLDVAAEETETLPTDSVEVDHVVQPEEAEVEAEAEAEAVPDHGVRTAPLLSQLVALTLFSLLFLHR